MEPLDLPGDGRRPRGGEEVSDAVLLADPVEEDLTSMGAEPGREHLAVVGEHGLRLSAR